MMTSHELLRERLRDKAYKVNALLNVLHALGIKSADISDMLGKRGVGFVYTYTVRVRKGGKNE